LVLIRIVVVAVGCCYCCNYYFAAVGVVVFCFCRFKLLACTY